MSESNLKGIWKLQDAADESINKEQLIKMLHKQSMSHIKKLLLKNIIGIVLEFIILLFLMYCFFLLNQDYRFVITNLGSILITLIFTGLSFKEYKLIKEIDIPNQEILMTQERFLNLKKYIIFEKAAGYILGPILVITLLPVFSYLFYGKIIFDNIQIYIFEIITGIIIFYPTFFIAFRILYSKNLKQFNSMLQEIKQLKE